MKRTRTVDLIAKALGLLTAVVALILSGCGSKTAGIELETPANPSATSPILVTLYQPGG